MAKSQASQPQETMTQPRALQPQEKKELVSKDETTVPVRYFVPATDIFETEDALSVVMEVPGVGPVLLLVSILTMTGYFQLFAEPYVMTEGGPLQATYSVLYFMFEEGFKWWSLGRASAVAFLLFILMFLVTVVQLRLGRERGGA